jgi:hypothetical protein
MWHVYIATDDYGGEHVLVRRQPLPVEPNVRLLGVFDQWPAAELDHPYRPPVARRFGSS